MPAPGEIANDTYDSSAHAVRVVPVGTGATADQVQGNVASAATDSGNPVKVGGKYNSTAPTFTDGQRGDLQLNNKGLVKVEVGAAFGSAYNTLNMVGNTGDGISGAAILAAHTARYNSSTYDLYRNNEEATLLASASRTTTQTGADITNYNGLAAVVVVLDMTTVGTGSVTLTIEGKDTASGKYYTLLAGAAVVTNSTNRYMVSPHIAAAANAIAMDILPRKFRINVTANNANAATYSVGYNLIRA